jgi:hypothetical protein
MDTAAASKVGVFLDVDNLFPYWLGKQQLEPATKYLIAEDFSSTLQRIAELAEAEGTVMTYEAYGHWANKARFTAATLMYHEYGYDLQHVPPLYRETSAKERPDQIIPTEFLKNAGDILLASRAILASVRTNSSLDTVVIGAADSDYQQLVIELKRLGVRVVCLSFPLVGSQRTLLASIYDEHRLLEPVQRWIDLQAAQERKATPPATKVPVEPQPKPTALAPPAIAAAVWDLLEAGAAPWATMLRTFGLKGGLSGPDCRVALDGLLSHCLVVLESQELARPEGALHDQWISDVAEAILDALVDQAYSNSTTESTTSRLDTARAQVIARFQEPNAELERAVSEALNRMLIR